MTTDMEGHLECHKEAYIHIQIQGIDHAKYEVDASFLKNNPVHLNLFEYFSVFMSDASQNR